MVGMKNAAHLIRLQEALAEGYEAQAEITAEWGASHHFAGQEAPPLPSDYDFRTSVTQEEAEFLVAEWERVDDAPIEF